MKTLCAGILAVMIAGVAVSAQSSGAAATAGAQDTTKTGQDAKPMKKAMKTMSATGTVKSVSGNSLVITGKDGKDMTFMVDDGTQVVAKGAGHMAADKKEAGEKMAITDVVKEGEKVSVKYHDMGGMMHAASVRVM